MYFLRNIYFKKVKNKSIFENLLFIFGHFFMLPFCVIYVTNLFYFRIICDDKW